MLNGLFIAGTYPAKRQITEETIHMKAIDAPPVLGL